MIERQLSNHRMSQIVKTGTTVYLSGQVAKDPVESVADQTRQILAQIESLLEQAGTEKKKLLSANIWLANIDDFQAMNEVWDNWADKEHLPVRACVESRLAREELKVEIQVVAAR
ncbi:hypothetical protein EOPP23_06515 [Endozoicomonas sp. OPT23]|uniref:RidA family protein n=1 Tax=Endozoicomonas sp. OPT23 TaxID=2072845 RepID=UPI00129B4EE1|nr:RidA family protein [Endozoicomonas sp. OPT23]MRI32639.1 hypothetical protein [Endozoicomonas sp. OPT23]